MSAKAEVFVAALDELAAGERRIIRADEKSIGVFNTGSQIVAVLNICPHAFAPVCLGKLSGTTLTLEAGRIHLGQRKRDTALPLAWLGIRPAQRRVPD